MFIAFIVTFKLALTIVIACVALIGIALVWTGG